MMDAGVAVEGDPAVEEQPTRRRLLPRASITKLIVYRHFGSKAELYQAVLDSVFNRLATEVSERIPRLLGRGAVPSALLVVAREQPDALRLLIVHSAREPEFAELVNRFNVVARLAAGAARMADGWRQRELLPKSSMTDTVEQPADSTKRHLADDKETDPI